MQRKSWLLVLVVLIVACAHGKTEHFPAPGDASQTVQVTIMRDNRLFGWGLSMRALLNGTPIAALRRGEYVQLSVAPGMHTVGIPQENVTLLMEAGRHYYFIIEATNSFYGFDFRRLEPDQGRRETDRLKKLE